ARAGDCIDVSDIDIWKAECDEPHDAEVIHAQQFDDTLVDQYVDMDVSELCARLTETSGYTDDVRRGSYELSTWVDSWDVEQPEPGDSLICVAEPLDGEKLDAPLPRDASPVQTGTETALYDLQVGDCFNEPDGLGEDDLIGFVRVVPCNQGHELELTSVVLVPAPEPGYPGDAVIEERAEECLSRFAAYLDIPYDDSRYESTYYSPTEESWDHGDRTIFCVVADPDGEDLTKSLKGAAR
ncbi:septum formation family protein, partial [Nocardioides sp. GCM10030258]|uniref:septum formation family protein n=1 Tax=unclassified Nocardioides TaxID=2615069 RepID=UPI00360EC3DB